MKFNQLAIAGVYTVDIDKHGDDRGFFARTWCAREFQSVGLKSAILQSNIAVSKEKGTLRGLHYQTAPFEEAKLIRCVRGSMYDVIVDLRRKSRTYKNWVGVELSSESYAMVYVPEGCAHGYQTLERDTEINYHVTQYYSPAHERGLRWNDPQFNIQWPITEGMVISDKDSNWPDYSAA